MIRNWLIGLYICVVLLVSAFANSSKEFLKTSSTRTNEDSVSVIKID